MELQKISERKILDSYYYIRHEGTKIGEVRTHHEVTMSGILQRHLWIRLGEFQVGYESPSNSVYMGMGWDGKDESIPEMVEYLMKKISNTHWE